MGGVGVDKKDNVYVFNSSHPMVVFDRDGNFLCSFGEGLFRARTPCSWRQTTIWLTDDGDHKSGSARSRERCC